MNKMLNKTTKLSLMEEMIINDLSEGKHKETISSIRKGMPEHISDNLSDVEIVMVMVLFVKDLKERAQNRTSL